MKSTGLAIIKYSVDWIEGLEEYVNKCKERLIIETSNKTSPRTRNFKKDREKKNEKKYWHVINWLLHRGNRKTEIEPLLIN